VLTINSAQHKEFRCCVSSNFNRSIYRVTISVSLFSAQNRSCTFRVARLQPISEKHGTETSRHICFQKAICNISVSRCNERVNSSNTLFRVYILDIRVRTKAQQ